MYAYMYTVIDILLSCEEWVIAFTAFTSSDHTCVHVNIYMYVYSLKYHSCNDLSHLYERTWGRSKDTLHKKTKRLNNTQVTYIPYHHALHMRKMLYNIIRNESLSAYLYVLRIP